MSCWVVDTGPLIFLAQLDHLDLLRHAADEVLVPPGSDSLFTTHPRPKERAMLRPDPGSV